VSEKQKWMFEGIQIKNNAWKNRDVVARRVSE
jgi:hypothetical protein